MNGKIQGIFETDFFAMGSPCVLRLGGPRNARLAEAAKAAIAEVRRIERRYSRYDPESLLSAINRVAQVGGGMCVDDETADLIDCAYRAYAWSQGLFDVTSGLLRRVWNDEIQRIPREEDVSVVLNRVGLDKLAWRRPALAFLVPGIELDFGGVAKEYAADRAAVVLRDGGVRHGFVNLGGDIAVVGPERDGSPWRIGVNDPLGGKGAVATLFVTAGGVATSGSYERFWEIGGRRFCHVLDPRTGWPVESLPSVTVAADTCLTAGLASTIALLKGDAAGEWLSGIGVDHLYVETTGKLGGSIVCS
jgi:thiamine biosynthesis lipoprotein